MKIPVGGSIIIATMSLTCPLFASSIDVVASSTGCFSAAPAACTVGTPTATIGGLTFTGENPISGITAFNSTIGEFDLSPVPYDYNGTYFGLFVTFTAPAGEPDAGFTASVTGKVNRQHNGDVRITFDNPTAFTQVFNGANGAGALSIELDDIRYNLNPASGGTHAVITADFSGTSNQVPEPGTVLLFGGGVALITLGRVKRVRAKL